MNVALQGTARRLADRSAGRTTSRLGQRSVTELKNGNLFIREINVPRDPVAPGGTVNVDVTVSNGALAVSSTDPDQCLVGDTPNRQTPGYDVTVNVDPDWAARDVASFCLPVTLVGTRDETRRFSFQAPQTAGIHEIEFWLSLPGSQTESGRVRLAIEVEAGGRPSPSPDGDAGDDQDGGGDGQAPGPFRPILCLVNPTRACTTAEVFAMASSLGILALFLILAAVG